MKLSRADIVPVLAIVVGGAMGTAATARMVEKLGAVSYSPVLLRHDQAVYVPDVRRPELSEELREMVEEIGRLQRIQADVQRRVGDLSAQTSDDRDKEIADLQAAKGRMILAIEGLERDLKRASTRGQGSGALSLDLAAALVTDSNLLERVRYSRGAIDRWDTSSAIALEHQIEWDLRAVRSTMEGAVRPEASRRRNGQTGR